MSKNNTDYLKDQLVNVWSTEKVDSLFERVEAGEKLDKSPFWEGDPEFRAANIVFEYTKEELDILERCAKDVKFFAEFCHVMTDDGIQPIKLRDYQEDILDHYATHRQCILLSPRQSGKCCLFDTMIIVREKNIIRMLSFGEFYYELLKKERKLKLFEYLKYMLYMSYSYLSRSKKDIYTKQAHERIKNMQQLQGKL